MEEWGDKRCIIGRNSGDGEHPVPRGDNGKALEDLAERCKGAMIPERGKRSGRSLPINHPARKRAGVNRVCPTGSEREESPR